MPWTRVRENRPEQNGVGRRYKEKTERGTETPLEIQKYRGEADKRRMLRLAQQNPEDNLHMADLPYRLSSWALDAAENVGLWTGQGGELMAWAVLQTPFWAIDYVLHPIAPADMHRRVLTWAEQRAVEVRGTPHGHPQWFVNVFGRQAERRSELEALGFADQSNVGGNSWSKTLLKCSARDAVCAPALPPGFTLRSLAGAAEAGAAAALHRAAFGSENMTEAWRRRTTEWPEYHTDLDLAAVSPDNKLAAFCLCWLDTAGPSGRVEPMGVAPEFLKLGLGQAILRESLRRLCQLGANHVFVECDRQNEAALALYQSVGFRAYEEVIVYRKEYKDA